MYDILLQQHEQTKGKSYKKLKLCSFHMQAMVATAVCHIHSPFFTNKSDFVWGGNVPSFLKHSSPESPAARRSQMRVMVNETETKGFWEHVLY